MSLIFKLQTYKKRVMHLFSIHITDLCQQNRKRIEKLNKKRCLNNLKFAIQIDIIIIRTIYYGKKIKSSMEFSNKFFHGY